MDKKSRSDTLLSRWVSARGRAKSCWKSKARRRTTCSPNFFTAAVELPTWWTRLQTSKCFCAYLYSRFGPVAWDQTLPGRMSGFGTTTQIRYRSLELSNWRIPDYGISKLVERMVGGRQGWQKFSWCSGKPSHQADKVACRKYPTLISPRAFPLQRGPTHGDQKQLTDYYFWELDQFSAKLPYICERHQIDIGCIQVTWAQRTDFANSV